MNTTAQLEKIDPKEAIADYIVKGTSFPAEIGKDVIGLTAQEIKNVLHEVSQTDTFSDEQISRFHSVGRLMTALSEDGHEAQEAFLPNEIALGSSWLNQQYPDVGGLKANNAKAIFHTEVIYEGDKFKY